MLAFELAKSGLFSSINEVYKSPVDLVMEAYDYLKFTSDYEQAFIELNTADKENK